MMSLDYVREHAAGTSLQESTSRWPNVGDVVVVNGQSTPMTVEGYVTQDSEDIIVLAACVWFAGKTLNRETFNPDILTKVAAS